MKTLDEIRELVEGMNETAHQDAWDTWDQADELEDSENEDDWAAAEEMRDEASSQQAGYFRDLYYELSEEDRAAIVHWLKHDEDFKEEFSMWFGEQYFEDEFDDIED